LTVEYTIVAFRFAAISVDGVVEVFGGRKLEAANWKWTACPEKGSRPVPRKKRRDKSSPRPASCSRVDGIDSITKRHWLIEFRCNSLARVQRNSEDAGLPHTSRRTMKAIVVKD
jgi:hypothetical protein